MLVTTRDGDEEKHEGDATGESILSGFGSSCGSSTDETFDQEEFIAELTRKMAENMLQEDEENSTISHLTATNKPKPSHFHPNHVVQNIKGRKYWHQNEQHRQMKEYGNGSSNIGGSGMKVVFLGEIGSKNRSSGGTGVFIPHATNNLPDHHPRKKPGRCPTVLIPERVLHTLKQHFEKRTANPNGVFHTNQNHKLQPQETSNKRVANNNVNNYQELQLPQEWTY